MSMCPWRIEKYGRKANMMKWKEQLNGDCPKRDARWPAPGSEDTELGVLMELEVGHGETEVHAGVQA